MKCRCGCGEKLQPISRSTKYRLKSGEKIGYIAGHAHRGKRNSRWNGGKTINSQGYRLVQAHDHPNARKDGYILEHRLVMSNHLGRPLNDSEVVHHKNGNKLDNNIENLELTTQASHPAKHHETRYIPPYVPRFEITCPVCETVFSTKRGTPARKTQRFCSKECQLSGMVREQACNVKLTQHQVSEIAALKGILPQRQVATRYGISKTQVGRIMRGDSWQ